MLFLVSK